MGETKLWIELDRLHVELLRFLVIFEQGVWISLDLIGLKVNDVSFAVVGRLGLDNRFLIRTQRHLQLVGDLRSELALQPQRISQSALVPVCPQMSIV